MVFIKIVGNNFKRIKIDKSYNLIKLGFLYKKKIIKKNIFSKKELIFFLKLKKLNFISSFLFNTSKFNFLKNNNKNIYIHIFLKYFENKPLFFF